MNLQGNGSGSRRGTSGTTVKVALLVIAVVLVGLLVFRLVERAVSDSVSVWLAKEELSAGAVIGADDLEERSVRRSDVPRGAILDRAALIGRTLLRAKSPGDRFTGSDFAVNGSGGVPGIARMIPEGRILMAIRVAGEDIPYQQLKQGDRLEVLVVEKPRNGPPSSRIVAPDAWVVGFIAPKASQGESTSGNGGRGPFGIDLRPPTRQRSGGGLRSVLLALHPEHVLPVAEAQGSGASFRVALHGRTEVEDGRMVRLPPSGPSAVEVIAGDQRERVSVRR